MREIAREHMRMMLELTEAADFELRRLEQRYVERKNRNTWTSDAVYVDGEYVSPTRSPDAISPVTSPTNTGSSRTTDSGFSWTSKGPVARMKELRRKSSLWLKR